jgi:hypothetical protein
MPGLSTRLQIGQTVHLEDQETGYRVTVLAGEQPGRKVVEVGPDHVVFDNAVEGVQTRVPCHLIKSVVTTPESAQPAA